MATPAALLCLVLTSLWFDTLFRRSTGFCRGGKGDVQPGVYHKPTPRNRAIAKRAKLAEFLAYRPTPWCWSGDLTTIWPFLSFTVPERRYERTWVRVEADGEKCALDWAFPAKTGFDPAKPVLVILHGLNGGSQEKYLLHLVHEATAQGWTCVVFIARGLMGTPISSGNFFHGARISDIHAAVCAIDKATPEGTNIVAAGYSMGAIVLSNYVAQIGSKSPLRAAVALSGCFNSVENAEFEFSRRVWQPPLAAGLKENFVPPFLDLFEEKGVDPWAVHRSYDIAAFDTAVIVPLNKDKYTCVNDYYTDMSASLPRGKLDGARIPLLAVNACDDPIVDVDTMPVADCDTNEALFLLVTRNGGHVGWPIGMFPGNASYSFQTQAVMSFVRAVVGEDGDDDDDDGA
eukprot:g3933.t1